MTPRFDVPVVVEATNADAAEAYVEGLLKGRIPAELPTAEFLFVGDADELEAGTE